MSTLRPRQKKLHNLSLDEYQEMLKKQVRDVWFTVYFIEDARVASVAATNETFIKEDLETRANVEVISFSVIQFVPDNKQGKISFHNSFYSRVTTSEFCTIIKFIMGELKLKASNHGSSRALRNSLEFVPTEKPTETSRNLPSSSITPIRSFLRAREFK